MVSIRKEINEIAEGKLDKLDNPLKNAPHTSAQIADENWNHCYSKKMPFPNTINTMLNFGHLLGE